jgi:hypothetical protein
MNPTQAERDPSNTHAPGVLAATLCTNTRSEPGSNPAIPVLLGKA